MFHASFIKDILTAGYLVDAVKSVGLFFAPEVPIQVLHADGGMHYERWDRQIEAGTYPRAEVVRSCMETEMAGPSGDDEVSRARRAQYEAVVAEATRAGLGVVLWTTPNSPELSERGRSNPRNVALALALHQLLGDLHERYGAVVIEGEPGGHVPAVPDDWYDCTHFGRQNAANTADFLAERAGTVDGSQR